MSSTITKNLTDGETVPVVATVDCNVVTPTTNFTLNALDRCDACGAQAYYQAELKDDKGTLLFCGHHYKKNEAKLLLISKTVLDETAKLK